MVCYTEDPTMLLKFKAQGVQIVGGVPFMCDEPAGLKTFRVGLFGIDKLKDIPGTVAAFETALDGVLNAPKL
eukprot:NODE_9475_length_368_cov_11.482759_g8570_i0.p2 GENE.NODE_9475_length_368_cov_11.482759_g8570_i0~~NODE_9475_length_368_cov_11.482759_g8570_i0.p2  ORF type:complete len:72 (+),score=19.53 NODE_9475_length_368_cov_11.482759_g8570_i0:80-295(+)